MNNNPYFIMILVCIVTVLFTQLLIYIAEYFIKLSKKRKTDENLVIEIDFENSEAEKVYGFDPITNKISNLVKKGDWIDLRYVGPDNPFNDSNDDKLPLMLSLGISIKLPKGYEAIVAPRSSTFKTFKILLANSIGVIDNAYNGSDDIWKFPAIKVASVDGVELKNGDRICQFRIQKSMGDNIKFVYTPNRRPSRGGLGSTGIK